MITIDIISMVNKKVLKDKEELANTIKYQIERKTSLEQVVREAEDAKKEIELLENKLKNNMCKYLGIL